MLLTGVLSSILTLVEMTESSVVEMVIGKGPMVRRSSSIGAGLDVLEQVDQERFCSTIDDATVVVA